MTRIQPVLATFLIALNFSDATAQSTAVNETQKFGPYNYEARPEGDAFAKFFPRLAPKPPGNLLKPGDRLAIIGDSITEQKMYSRIMETYLTVCHPEMHIAVRQYGWSGERAEGFLRRMDQDLFTGKPGPTIATLCYGMNDTRYRPFDVNNGLWYRDHYAAIVRRLKSEGARVVLGSPGCAGRLATWVKSKSGTLDEHNLHLCALRDIAIGIALEEDVAFADMFWPMYVAQVTAAEKYGRPEQPYRVAGRDGIHPGWAGHLMMAYQFLHSMGISGDIATIQLDLLQEQAQASEGHQVIGFDGQTLRLESTRYPFCASGRIDDENSIRSGMTLVPFQSELNRFLLQVTGLEADEAKVIWGEQSKVFSRDELQQGVNLAQQFETSPFQEAFDAVDQAVAEKQAFETVQIKKIFHGQRGKIDLMKAVQDTETKHLELVRAVQAKRIPVRHTLRVEPIR